MVTGPRFRKGWHDLPLSYAIDIHRTINCKQAFLNLRNKNLNDKLCRDILQIYNRNKINTVWKDIVKFVRENSWVYKK